MALATSQDIALLQRWSFISAYQKDRQALRGVGVTVCKNLTSIGVAPNGLSDIERPLAMALFGSAVFQSLCLNKMYASPALHYTFALAMARYILDSDWAVLGLFTP
jgi:hypothetical protein